MSILRHEVEEMLIDIKKELGLKANVDDIIKPWLRLLERHKPGVIIKAKDALVDSWELNRFPKPGEFRHYLASAYTRDEEVRHSHDQSTLHEMHPRVSKLLNTSQRNIDVLPMTRGALSSVEPNKTVMCYICGEPALRNLTIGDYMEYHGHRDAKENMDTYACGKHTDEMITNLGENRYV